MTIYIYSMIYSIYSDTHTYIWEIAQNHIWLILAPKSITSMTLSESLTFLSHHWHIKINYTLKKKHRWYIKGSFPCVPNTWKLSATPSPRGALRNVLFSSALNIHSSFNPLRKYLYFTSSTDLSSKFKKHRADEWALCPTPSLPECVMFAFTGCLFPFGPCCRKHFPLALYITGSFSPGKPRLQCHPF